MNTTTGGTTVCKECRQPISHTEFDFANASVRQMPCGHSAALIWTPDKENPT